MHGVVASDAEQIGHMKGAVRLAVRLGHEGTGPVYARDVAAFDVPSVASAVISSLKSQGHSSFAPQICKAHVHAAPELD
jgi:hypothetical protein